MCVCDHGKTKTHQACNGWQYANGGECICFWVIAISRKFESFMVSFPANANSYFFDTIQGWSNKELFQEETTCPDFVSIERQMLVEDPYPQKTRPYQGHFKLTFSARIQCTRAFLIRTNNFACFAHFGKCDNMTSTSPKYLCFGDCLRICSHLGIVILNDQILKELEE